MSRRLLVSATVLLAVSFGGNVAAQEAVPTDAEALIERGVALREAGRDEDAVAVFRQARALEDSPRIQAQLGLALLASGQFVESYELLEGALAARDPWIEAHADALRGSFESAAQNVGVVEITGGEPGAAVRVNGSAVGAMPLPRSVHAATGRAVIEVELAGYRPFSAEVVVEPGRTSRLRVTLLAVRPVGEPAPRVPQGTDGGDDWLVPLLIVGGVLAVGGVVTGLAVGLQQPAYERSDVGGVVMTLEARL